MTLYTPAELRQFDRLTLRACSPSQMVRLRARLDLKAFEAARSPAAIAALWAAVLEKDSKRRTK